MGQDKTTNYTLQRTGASEQIFYILKNNIATGVWKPGEKIASENELAKQFGVSRMTARNALQRLSAIGLIESKVGEGSFVKEFRLSSYVGEIADLLETKNSIHDIREFRSFFEASCLLIACNRRTDEDIKNLKCEYENLCEIAFSGDYEAFNEADMAFHRCICKISGNDVFLMVQYILQDLLRTQVKCNSNLYGIVKGASDNPKDDNFVLKLLAKEHEKYITALVKRDYRIAIDDRDSYLAQYENMK